MKGVKLQPWQKEIIKIMKAYSKGKVTYKFPRNFGKVTLAKKIAKLLKESNGKK
jgi:hypothetical protein